MANIFLFFGKCFLVAIDGDIKFAANHRFYFQVAILIFVFISFCYKFKSAKHIAMITDRQSRHTIFNSFFIKILYRGRSI